MTAEEYAKKFLPFEVAEIIRTDRLKEYPELSIYEKAIIFKYSDDGYENLNEQLRVSKGVKNNFFGKVLDESLKKLPDFIEFVYRGVELNKSELEHYKACFEKKKFVTEHSFFSTSKNKAEAYKWCKGKYGVLFQILSKHGKAIETVSKHFSEREVLFRLNTSFKIIDFKEPTIDSDFYFIKMIEI